MHPHFCSIENPLAFPSVNVASQVDKRYIVLLIKQTIYRFEVGPAGHVVFKKGFAMQLFISLCSNVHSHQVRNGRSLNLWYV